LETLKIALENNGIETYDRKGILTGAYLGQRRYRLITLGVAKEHLKMMTMEQKRLDELRGTRKDQKNRGIELD